ncbi:hypothetical protein LOTGIDRAFT_239135 [Lottia gigantea]|uniref:Uncharacterized protein n=1 Tax=Lottia gigantea TaxID=225164 RepID=V4AWX8_LOTGI|nr:hypothetical protein LOTGIDRAFT_239135 [Lottia gigantea]ESO98036.1 hypothetical protein LOTGIDRAFT_239135 [Lottia gigantea]
MVLTNLPFERNSLLQSRYHLIQRPDSAPIVTKSIRQSGEHVENEKGKQAKNYASFLKEQERKVCPDGFVDSGRYSYTYQRKKDNPLRSSSSPRIDLITFHRNAEEDGTKHEKCLKVIEDLMWQHKQQERELKRTEGDIVKNQQAVRHTLRDYENAINKKKMAESKKLSHSLEKYTILQQDHIHNKEQLILEQFMICGKVSFTLILEQFIISGKTTLARIQKSQSTNLSIKDDGRKVDLTKTDLARKYRSKLSEIELKRTEVNRLNEEYENKLKLKENEEFRLKQEAAALALSLNMETVKGKTKQIETARKKKEDEKKRIEDDLNNDMEFSSKLAKSDGDIKTTESYNRKLSADLSRTKHHLDIKKRDEQRRLTDTKMRLANNTNTQRLLNEEAINVEMDKKVREMNQRVQEHNDRRINQLQSNLKEKKVKRENQQSILEARFKKRLNEQQRREHEDSLKFFQKMVNKDDDIEQDLYSKVRATEYDRQQQEQQVRRLELNLAEMKRKNAAKLKQEINERNTAELQLEQKILRDKAELEKLHTKREESYLRLQQHRQLSKEDKYLLREHEREHTRLMRIGAKTETVS